MKQAIVEAIEKVLDSKKYDWRLSGVKIEYGSDIREMAEKIEDAVDECLAKRTE
jgi:hypothetical protein